MAPERPMTSRPALARSWPTWPILVSSGYKMFGTLGFTHLTASHSTPLHRQAAAAPLLFLLHFQISRTGWWRWPAAAVSGGLLQRHEESAPTVDGLRGRRRGGIPGSGASAGGAAGVCRAHGTPACGRRGLRGRPGVHGVRRCGLGRGRLWSRWGSTQIWWRGAGGARLGWPVLRHGAAIPSVGCGSYVRPHGGRLRASRRCPRRLLAVVGYGAGSAFGGAKRSGVLAGNGGSACEAGLCGPWPAVWPLVLRGAAFVAGRHVWVPLRGLFLSFSFNLQIPTVECERMV